MDKGSKILVVTTTAETLLTILAGQEKFLSGHFNVRLCCSRDEHFNDLALSSSRNVFCVPMKRGITPFFDLYSLFRMIMVIIRFRPDVIHSYTPKAGLIAMAAGWLCRTPHRVHTFTGLVFPTAVGLRRRLLLFVDRVIAFFSTIIIPESQGVMNDLINNKVVPAGVSVIGNGNVAGIDVDHFSRGSCDERDAGLEMSNFLLSPDSFVFCYVGRINKDKGIKELVASFEGLPHECELIMIGALDATAPPDQPTLDKIDSNPRIHSMGFQSDIRRFVVSSDVLVLPSYREGFPNVVLQAMALEVPVISTNVSGSNEVIIQDLTGWLVPTKDVDLLRGAMVSAFHTSRQKLKDMGRHGRKIVVSKYERSRYLDALLDFYRSIIN